MKSRKNHMNLEKMISLRKRKLRMINKLIKQSLNSFYQYINQVYQIIYLFLYHIFKFLHK